MASTPSSPPTVDGVPVGDVVAPESAEQVAALLREAADRGHGVIPTGRGTQLALGNPPRRADVAVSTANLGGILDYEPTDLVLSVGAGARLGDVQAVLGEHGQWLPIDPPGGDDATIGGLIATALTGPRRLASGSLRDLLIGITVAHAGGTVSKAGGMVVKNVSGFDMPRLYHGSLGTLGVIVSANFKVLPRARAEQTVVCRFPDLDGALAAAERVRESRVPATGLEVAMDRAGTRTAVRIESREASLPPLVTEATRLAGGDAVTLATEASRAWWVAEAEPFRLDGAGDDVIVRCTTRPRDAGEMVRGALAALAALDATVVRLAVSPAVGEATIRLALADGSSASLAAVQSALLGVARHVTVLAAPAAAKADIDVWGPLPEGHAVMAALKAQFDPDNALNPGRFAGRL